MVSDEKEIKQNKIISVAKENIRKVYILRKTLERMLPNYSIIDIDNLIEETAKQVKKENYEMNLKVDYQDSRTEEEMFNDLIDTTYKRQIK